MKISELIDLLIVMTKGGPGSIEDPGNHLIWTRGFYAKIIEAARQEALTDPLVNDYIKKNPENEYTTTLPVHLKNTKYYIPDACKAHISVSDECSIHISTCPIPMGSRKIEVYNLNMQRLERANKSRVINLNKVYFGLKPLYYDIIEDYVIAFNHKAPKLDLLVKTIPQELAAITTYCNCYNSINVTPDTPPVPSTTSGVPCNSDELLGNYNDILSRALRLLGYGESFSEKIDPNVNQ